jgi:4-hydroxyphenylacetate 3-monooxygenase
LRPLITMTSERIINIFEHVATSAPVFTPTAEDFNAEELRPLLDVYGRGKGVDAHFRYKLCRLAWELSSSSFGGRQQLYERLHSGSPEVIVSGAYQKYDKSKGIAMVKRIIGQ